MLHTLVDFRLLLPLVALPFLRAKPLHHAAQRIFTRVRVQPAFACGLQLTLQAFDQSALLDDRLIDALDKLLDRKSVV